VGQRLLAFEYALAGYAPVNALRSGAVRQLAFDRLRCMGRLRPDDRLPVAPGDQEQALAAGRGSIVAGAQDAMLNHIVEGFQLTEEAPPGASFTLRVGHQELLLAWHPLARGSHAAIQPDVTAGLLAALGHQGAPAADLLHILQADDPRLADASPFRHRSEEHTSELQSRE